MAKRKPCTKKPYPTKEAAQAAIRGMVRKYGSITFKKAYRCGQCKAWHITGKPHRGPRRVQH
jgi:hypothetical protein